MNTFLGNTARVAAFMSVAGFLIGIPGCRLSPSKRIPLINEQAEIAEARADRVLAKRVRACRGDPACIQAAHNEHQAAMQLLQAIQNRRIDGELSQAQEAENAWDTWLRSLPPDVRKFWEQLSPFIEKLKKLINRSEGVLVTGALRVLTTDDPDGAAGSGDPAVLTPQAAAANAVSLIGSPDSWEQAYRLTITGSVAYEIVEGDETIATTGVFHLEGMYNGTLRPGDSIGLTGGTVSLFGGELTIRLSTVVGGSNLRIFANGNGFLRIAGFTDHADEWNDTDSGDQVVLEIPVRLEGQDLRISSGGAFVPGHLLLERPRDLIADYDGDGMVNAFDLSAFMADYHSGDPYADVNADGVVDQADLDLFMSEFNDAAAWRQFRTDWSTAP